MRIGSLELDPLSRQVWLGGEPVTLSKKEYALLRALAGDPTRVFTREELLRGVWGFRAMGTMRTLDSHAFRLRQKLNRAGGRFVVNVWGISHSKGQTREQMAAEGWSARWAHIPRFPY
jgi:DNA-binding response OmpR family regulator